jgi:CelD/BcsL family acetyltransferase involved in cellulose biosynthesis
MFDVVVIKDFESTILKENWNRLLEADADANAHLTYEWLKTWWEHFGKSHELFILVIKDNDKVIGIAPLMITIQNVLPYIAIKRIEFIGTGITDYHNFIISHRHVEVLETIFNFLKDQDWHIIKLRQLPSVSKNYGYFQSYLMEKYYHQWQMSLKPTVTCPYIAIEGNSENFFNSLGKNLRYDLKRKIRKLQEVGDVRFECYSGKENNLSQLFDDIFSIHSRSWKDKDQRCAFSLEQEVNRKFFQQITTVLGAKDWLRFFALFLNNKLIAYICCFTYRNTIYHWNTSFDPDYFRYSVGKILHYYAIENAIGNGFKEFDFMRGEEEYKMKWTKIVRTNYEFLIAQHSLLSRIAMWYYEKLKPGIESNKLLSPILNNKLVAKIIQ